MKRCVCLSMVMMLVSLSALAGEWYAGADVGYVEHDFTPLYSFVSGRADAEFENEASGNQIGINGGYIQEVCDFFSVGCQAHISANDSEWTLSLPDPANFEYEQPYTWGLSVIPKIKLWRKASLVLEAGLIQGTVSEKKYGSLETNYDASETIGGTILGAGVSYSISDSMDLVVKYQKSDFSSFAYKTYSPAGAQVETVWDNPTAESWSLGVSRRW